ncbi:hypothetical protein [Nocardioides sp.]|uniref:hypothetical protein n=1 Tax=Nocardioides sp. TaxID=35761 RepID=UPI0037836B5A
MTIASAGTNAAMQGLAQVLETSRRLGVPPASWRWTARQRLAALRDALLAEVHPGTEGWFAARGGSLLRERTLLLTRLSELGPRVLEHPDLEAVSAELHRLLADIGHHVQRLHDLAYDEVELELGGSE